MRLHIDDHYFLSVIESESSLPNKIEKRYSVQVMKLVHGMGMQNATIFDDQSDVVSCIVHDSDLFSETSDFFTSLNEVFAFHLQCMKGLKVLELD